MLHRTVQRVVPVALAISLQGPLAIAAQPRPSGAGPSTDLIQRGRELFEDQQYEESIQTLSGALVRPNSSKEQKLAMYRLLALDYITLGQSEEAENFVRALLGLQPDYELPKTESPRFRDFFAEARAKWEAEGRPGLITEQEALKPVALRHRSPALASPEAGIVLTAQLDDPGRRVLNVKLFFRNGSTGKFSEERTLLDAGAGSIRAVFPARVVKPPFVAYYLQAEDKNGVPLASSGDADAPLKIPVPESGRSWVLPVAIGGGLVIAAGIVVGALAASGAFSGGKP
jgi:hypothetical protein